jgi:hypothetical protein
MSNFTASKCSVYLYNFFSWKYIWIDSSEWLFIYWLCIRFLTRLYRSEEWAGRKKKDCLFCVIKSSNSYQSITQRVYGVECHFQQYFSYIVAVSFIGGGNRIIRSKPPTCRKSLTIVSQKLYRIFVYILMIGMSHYRNIQDFFSALLLTKCTYFVYWSTAPTFSPFKIGWLLGIFNPFKMVFCTS